MLCWIIKGDDSIDTITTDTPVTLTDVATKRRVSSIAQDIIFSATSGRVKQPKHIALSMTIKSMTGSAKVITMLNRFGHSISLSQLRECDTAMANRQIETTHQGETLVPSNIRPNSFATFCWDNNDLCEETLAGEGTTHCTNGIIIQRKSVEDGHQQQKLSSVSNRHNRSFSMPAYLEVEYNAGRRPQPIPISVLPEEIDAANAVQLLNSNDFVWILSRIEDLDHKMTPSWSGFNSLISDMVIRQSAIGYLPVIPSSYLQRSYQQCLRFSNGQRMSRTN